MSVSSVSVKIGDISSGGVKGRSKRGPARPRPCGISIMFAELPGMKVFWKRADGVAGRVRATSQLEVSFAGKSLTFRRGDVGRVPGRLGRREGGNDLNADAPRPPNRLVQSTNGSMAVSSHRCDVSAETNSSSPSSTAGESRIVLSRSP